jgi:hypothetical protein
MATTKARTSIWSSQTLTAGAGDTTSTAVDLSDGYGAQVNIKLTNGATGPTVAAQVQIQYSADDTTYFNYGGPLVGNTDNNGVESWSVTVPIGVEYIELVAGSNTGQNVTVDADISEVTAVS